MSDANCWYCGNPLTTADTQGMHPACRKEVYAVPKGVYPVPKPPLSLRDQFARLVLGALPELPYALGESDALDKARERARWAYMLADAMLKARRQPSGDPG